MSVRTADGAQGLVPRPFHSFSQLEHLGKVLSHRRKKRQGEYFSPVPVILVLILPQWNNNNICHIKYVKYAMY